MLTGSCSKNEHFVIFFLTTWWFFNRLRPPFSTETKRNETKNVKEPTGAAIPWIPSSERASDWLVGLFYLKKDPAWYYVLATDVFPPRVLFALVIDGSTSKEEIKHFAMSWRRYHICALFSLVINLLKRVINYVLSVAGITNSSISSTMVMLKLGVIFCSCETFIGKNEWWFMVSEPLLSLHYILPDNPDHNGLMQNDFDVWLIEWRNLWFLWDLNLNAFRSGH